MTAKTRKKKPVPRARRYVRLGHYLLDLCPSCRKANNLGRG